MATKTANLYARIEPDVKEQAENILSALGIPETELHAELEKGYADMIEGKTKTARQVFSDIRKDYGL